MLLALTGHTGNVFSVAWSPDGRKIATASGDHTARVWNSSSGSTLLSLTGHVDDVTSIAWSSDGSKIATASYDRTSRVWNSSSPSVLPSRLTDVCSSNLHNCARNAECSADDRKTFSCECRSGYYGEPTSSCDKYGGGGGGGGTYRYRGSASEISLHLLLLFLCVAVAIWSCIDGL